jgi:hypothetical protein
VPSGFGLIAFGGTAPFLPALLGCMITPQAPFRRGFFERRAQMDERTRRGMLPAPMPTPRPRRHPKPARRRAQEQDSGAKRSPSAWCPHEKWKRHRQIGGSARSPEAEITGHGMLAKAPGRAGQDCVTRSVEQRVNRGDMANESLSGELAGERQRRCRLILLPSLLTSVGLTRKFTDVMVPSHPIWALLSLALLTSSGPAGTTLRASLSSAAHHDPKSVLASLRVGIRFWFFLAAAMMARS